MIEFKGYLTRSALKHLRKSYFKVMWSILSIAFIIGAAIISSIIHIEKWALAILLLIPVYIIFCVLCPYLIMRFDKTHIPKHITIKDDMILCITDEIGAEGRKIGEVKVVRDYGEFYAVIFYGLNIHLHFICQKDLLTQGSINEFEELFAGKIKRM